MAISAAVVFVEVFWFLFLHRFFLALLFFLALMVIYLLNYTSGGRYTRYDEPDDGDGGFNSFGFSGGNENILLSKAL